MRVRLIFIFVLACYVRTLAIVPALEREVNLTLNNEKIVNALAKIQEQTGLVFSYQPSIINGIGPVSLQLKHRTVREALALMFPKNVFFKAKNNYVILKEKQVEKNPKKTEVSGYVYDQATDQKLANVTIYDKNTLQSVTTNEYGFYSITVPNNEQCLSVNKENYRDTCVSFTYLKDSKLNNISIDQMDKVSKARDSVRWRQRFNDFGESTTALFKRFKGYANTMNVKDSLTRRVQVSLLPFIGSNHRLSGNVYNKISLNIYGGFAKGVNGFEIGGLFNIDRENVTGVQLAGTFNIVGGNVKGTQLAGNFNITGKSMNGFQAATLLNINRGTQKGVQLAGLININNKSTEGTSAAALLNISHSVRGAQIAGIGNISDSLAGASVAAIMNVSSYGNNVVQIAGLFNSVKNGSSQVQIAALFNSTSYLKGIQIGLLNFSDSATGVPIGLFSYVKKGVHQIELSTDELFTGNLTFRTGTPAFYNIFSIGGQMGSQKHLTQLGYGVGSSLRLKNKLHGEITATAHHVSSRGFYFGTSELCRFYLGLEYKVGKKFSIAAGPTLNFYISDTLDPDYESLFNTIPPYHISNSTSQYGFNTKAWVGGKIALRFL